MSLTRTIVKGVVIGATVNALSNNNRTVVHTGRAPSKAERKLMEAQAAREAEEAEMMRRENERNAAIHRQEMALIQREQARLQQIERAEKAEAQRQREAALINSFKGLSAQQRLANRDWHKLYSRGITLKGAVMGFPASSLFQVYKRSQGSTFSGAFAGSIVLSALTAFLFLGAVTVPMPFFFLFAGSYAGGVALSVKSRNKHLLALANTQMKSDLDSANQLAQKVARSILEMDELARAAEQAADFAYAQGASNLEDLRRKAEILTDAAVSAFTLNEKASLLPVASREQFEIYDRVLHLNHKMTKAASKIAEKPAPPAAISQPTAVTSVSEVPSAEPVAASPVVVMPDGETGISPENANSQISPGKSNRNAASLSPLNAIKKLSELHTAGILSNEEFEAKKQELLARV